MLSTDLKGNKASAAAFIRRERNSVQKGPEEDVKNRAVEPQEGQKSNILWVLALIRIIFLTLT